MKKLVLLLMVLMLLASITLAQSIQIVFWENMGAKLGETLQTITTMFNKENPNIDVQLVFVGSGDQLDTKLLASAKTNSLPTIAQVHPAWMGTLADENILVQLNSFSNFNAAIKDIYPSIIKMGEINGKMYGMPFNSSMMLIYCRPLMFEEAGITYPKTIEELENDAKILTIKKDGKTIRYGIGFNSAFSILTMVAAQFGGGIYVTPNGSITINSPQNVKALTFLVNLIKDGYAYVKPDNAYFDNELTGSSIAMLVGGGAELTYNLSDISGQKDGLVMIPMPYGANGKTIPVIRGDNVVIFNTSTKQQQEDAWKYIQFLLSPAIQLYWSMNTDYPPLNKQTLNLAQWKDYVNSVSYNPTAIVDGIQDAIPYSPNLPWFDSLIFDTREAVANACHFTMTPQQALDWAQKQAEQAYKNYYSK